MWPPPSWSVNYTFCLSLYILFIIIHAPPTHQVLAVLLPTIRDLPRDSPFAKCLLLALAFACNIGGMLTPISSPQNTVSLAEVHVGDIIHFVYYYTFFFIIIHFVVALKYMWGGMVNYTFCLSLYIFLFLYILFIIIHFLSLRTVDQARPGGRNLVCRLDAGGRPVWVDFVSVELGLFNHGHET